MIIINDLFLENLNDIESRMIKIVGQCIQYDIISTEDIRNILSQGFHFISLRCKSFEFDLFKVSSCKHY